MPLSKLQKPTAIDKIKSQRTPVRNVKQEHLEQLSALDTFALKITNKVGTFGFFLTIFTWTVIWTGYNILASLVPSLHWKAFDPFPSFVAYLLISNVIQILLMPLIMVGQNLQSRHSDLRAQNDYEVNLKAEQEIELILTHLEYQNEILIKMVEKLGISESEADAELTPQVLVTTN